MADEFKAFQGRTIVIPFFPEQKALSESATFQVTVFFWPKQQKKRIGKNPWEMTGFPRILQPPFFWLVVCFISFSFPKVFQDTPNIVVIMNDDVGYGAPDTFGGPIHTPTLSKLASHGVPWWCSWLVNLTPPKVHPHQKWGLNKGFGLTIGFP